MSSPNKQKRNKKKTIKVIVAVFLSLILVFLIVCSGYMISFRDEISVFNTIKSLGTSGLYTMDYSGVEYDLDDVINYGIYDESRLFEYISKKTFGFPIHIDIDKLMNGGACTSFSAITPDDDHIFARNFDYEETDSILLTSNPKKEYKSISNCDMSVIGFSEDFKPDSFFRKFFTLATIFTPEDGMNEKGVGISVLDLPNTPVHQDTGKPDVTTSLIIRLVLDRAANTQEAIDIFNSYDMNENDYVGTDYHFLSLIKKAIVQ